MFAPEINKHYWLKNAQGAWTIGQLIKLEEPDAIDKEVEGFVIIGSTVTVPVDWPMQIRGPIELDGHYRIR
jgi:hypothetical protein